jgi:hypothetical protein
MTVRLLLYCPVILVDLGGKTRTKAERISYSVADTIEPGYNNIGLYDTSLIESDTLWFQLRVIRDC